jgi:hypothetical protein
MPNNSDALISLAKEVFSDLTEAEESFFRLNAIGDYPVFGDGSSDLDKPEKADEWGPERTIRADCLRWLCLAQAARPLIVGIRLRAVGAKIQGLLQLDYSLIPFVLAFDRSCFTDWITFEKSRLVGLEITGTRLKKSIYAAGLGVSGSIQIWNESVVEGQLFFDAMYPSRFASRNIALTALRSWFVVVAEAFCATRYLNSTNAVSVTEARSRSAEGPRNSMRNPDIFRPVIGQSAYAFVLVHNHPSGDASPSEADMRLTRRLAEGARLLQINLLDHVIVGQPFDGRPGYFSFKEAGTI